MNLHVLINAFILGIIEGITEFLPISSTGHMIIVGYWLGFTSDKAKSFEVIIQLGSILAVIISFWRRLFSLIGINTKYDKLLHQITDHNHLTLIHIILAILPIFIIGLLFQNKINIYFVPKTVVLSLIVGSFLLLVAEKYLLTHPRIIMLDNITYFQAFIVGCFQCLAIWPGFSRSGATISGGLLVGMSRFVALEFSFILSVPTMIGTTILTIYKSFPLLSLVDLPMFIVGFITTFIIAISIIKICLKIIQKTSFIPFVIYRFIVAILVYIIMI
ncbi:Undecaprenyl-diphosphatase [Candidatus Profftia lariciata]|nr:Undecaprenyl-diphosphatase [Candidatus Profftia lariciata]